MRYNGLFVIVKKTIKLGLFLIFGKENTATVRQSGNKSRIIEGYEQVFADFVKRLQSYLKRYGLTKLDTWTYWIDE
jgi:hypothetical protein